MEVILKKHNEQLKHIFSQEEILQMSQTLAYENKLHRELEDAKKSAMSDFKWKIDSCAEEISQFPTKINNGFDYREIECETLMDNPTIGKKTIVRLDTKEVVRTERMTQEEMQGDMFEND